MRPGLVIQQGETGFMYDSLCAAQIPDQLQSVAAAITQDKIQLPSLPDLVKHIRDEIASPNSTARSVAKLVAHDPSLAATILRFANSPLYGSATAAKTLPVAVQRLGLNLVSSLTLATISRQLFHASSAWTDAQLARVWKHSVRTAGISQALAPQFGVDPDLALLAGLLHDVGSLVMLVHMENTPSLFINKDRLDCLLFATRTEAGLSLARHWNLPLDVTQTIQSHNVITKPEMANPVLGSDVVRAASWFSTEVALQGDMVADQRKNALARLGFDPKHDLLADPSILRQVDTIVRLLRGDS